MDFLESLRFWNLAAVSLMFFAQLGVTSWSLSEQELIQFSSKALLKSNTICDYANCDGLKFFKALKTTNDVFIDLAPVFEHNIGLYNYFTPALLDGEMIFTSVEFLKLDKLRLGSSFNDTLSTLATWYHRAYLLAAGSQHKTGHSESRFGLMAKTRALNAICDVHTSAHRQNASPIELSDMLVAYNASLAQQIAFQEATSTARQTLKLAMVSLRMESILQAMRPYASIGQSEMLKLRFLLTQFETAGLTPAWLAPHPSEHVIQHYERLQSLFPGGAFDPIGQADALESVCAEVKEIVIGLQCCQDRE